MELKVREQTKRRSTMIIGFCEEEGRWEVIANGQVLSWHDSENGALSELHACGAPVTPEEKLLRAIFGEKGSAPRAEEIEETQPDGSVRKVAGFRHAGWVEVSP